MNRRLQWIVCALCAAGFLMIPLVFGLVARGSEADVALALALAHADGDVIPTTVSVSDHIVDDNKMVATPNVTLRPVQDETEGAVLTPRPAPEAAVPQSSVAQAPSAPPAAGILWVTPAQAKASPLPDYWCVTKEDGSCIPCLRLKSLLADPKVVAWSRHYDCVKSDRLDGKLPKGYPVQLWGKRVREGVLPGYGVNELMWDFAGTKPAKPKAVKVAAVRQGYRSRSGGHWSYPGNIYSHLISEHGAGIDEAWIRSLSTNEARTLHDDLHTGRADWSRIVRR